MVQVGASRYGSFYGRDCRRNCRKTWPPVRQGQSGCSRQNPPFAPTCRKGQFCLTGKMNTSIPTEKALPRLAVSVEEFAELLGMSERSAWTIVKNEELRALAENRASRLPLISPLEGGKTKRLRMSDVQAWLDAQ